MQQDKIVQFVFFDTILNSAQFTAKWENYTRSVNSDDDVTLQQSEKNGSFRYVAQHRTNGNGFQFVFSKGAKNNRNPETEVKVSLAGGYLLLHAGRADDTFAKESKIFIFINYPGIDLSMFDKFSAHAALNVYEAYYENCKFTYILEFFVKNNHAGELLHQLKEYDAGETAIYKECRVHAV